MIRMTSQVEEEADLPTTFTMEAASLTLLWPRHTTAWLPMRQRTPRTARSRWPRTRSWTSWSKTLQVSAFKFMHFYWRDSYLSTKQESLMLIFLIHLQAGGLWRMKISAWLGFPLRIWSCRKATTMTMKMSFSWEVCTCVALESLTSKSALDTHLQHKWACLWAGSTYVLMKLCLVVTNSQH